MKPIRIGLTGGIGVGKSSVAAILAEYGAEIIVGDELGRIALENSPESLDAIKARYGSSMFADDGKLLRRELGKRIFALPEDARWLTALSFPQIHQLWQEAVAKTRNSVIVFDAALIFEWGIEAEFDFLVVVMATANVVKERLVESGRLSAAEVVARQTIQAATHRHTATEQIIVNNGAPDELRRQVDTFWRNVVEPELHRESIQ